MLIDTHCHLTMMVQMATQRPFSIDDTTAIQDILNESTHAGVPYIVTVGAHVSESILSIALAQKFKNIFASVGVHPSDCTADWQQEIKKIETLLAQHHDIVAVGECGLDFYHPGFDVQAQKDAFKAQIELALRFNKALIIHTRNAQDQALRILEEYAHDNLRAVFHCFSETSEMAFEIIKQNYYIGLGGSITYPKNESLRTIASNIPLENIVLETDAPFLPPQPFRGKLNHPRHIALIAEYLAQLRNIDRETVATQTTRNAEDLFNIKLMP